MKWGQCKVKEHPGKPSNISAEIQMFVSATTRVIGGQIGACRGGTHP